MRQLLEEHAKIAEVSNIILAIVNDAPPENMSDLARLRLQVNKLLNAHFLAEDDVLGPLMWRMEGVPGELLKRWAAQRKELRALYSEHLHEWPLSLLEDHWSAYGKSLKNCLKLGEALIRLEESEIYPLAASAG